MGYARLTQADILKATAEAATAGWRVDKARGWEVEVHAGPADKVTIQLTLPTYQHILQPYAGSRRVEGTWTTAL